jgi:hypothetical protein
MVDRYSISLWSVAIAIANAVSVSPLIGQSAKHISPIYRIRETLIVGNCIHL